MKPVIKRYFPKYMWDLGRRSYFYVINQLEKIGPAEKSIEYCGMMIYYNRGNALIRRITGQKVFEPELMNFIVEELKDTDKPIMVDVGANIGIVSMYISKKISKLKLYSFEPGPLQYSFLVKNVNKNNLSEQIEVNNFALGKEDGEATFYVHDPRYIALDGFIHTGRRSETRTIRVNVKKLDSWWMENGKPKINVIKIDTEGAEYLVLQGAKEVLRSCKPTIFMEIEPRNIKVYPYSVDDIIHYLNDMSYELFNMNSEKMNSNNIWSSLDKGNDTYIARPRSILGVQD